MIEFLVAARNFGPPALLGHPAETERRDSVPSIWQLSVMIRLRDQPGVALHRVDVCVRAVRQETRGALGCPRSVHDP
eukprot:9188747-Pyramimonas_sp.AAC.1